MGLKGKTAVVTGGTRGIGKAIVLELARQGADVAFTYAKSAEQAIALEEEIKNCGSKAMAVQSDASDFNQSKQMIDSVIKNFGKVDVLVNNAGITRDKALMMMSEEDWRKVIDTNLNGVFNCTRAVIIPMMKQKGGTIVNMSSVSGVTGMAGQVNYASSKAGIIGFTKSLAKEVARYGITVNAVAPGFIETEMIKGLDKKYLDEMLKRVPLGRLGTVEEVAEVVSFFISDAAKYITGQVLNIDGGMAM